MHIARTLYAYMHVYIHMYMMQTRAYTVRRHCHSMHAHIYMQPCMYMESTNVYTRKDQGDVRVLLYANKSHGKANEALNVHYMYSNTHCSPGSHMLIEHDVHALSEQTMNIGVSQVDLYEA